LPIVYTTCTVWKGGDMPIIRSAKKQLRQSLKHRTKNVKVRKEYAESIKASDAKPSKKSVAKAYSRIDTAVKKHVIHKNKARRLKQHVARNVKD